MRIIGGQYSGIRINAPANLPVRPTTDIAKEALFNILNNKIELHGAVCLDLFAGTGNISLELASRGAEIVDAVDIHFKCIQFIKEISQKLKINTIRPIKADVLKFIKTNKQQYDFVFVDPPFDMPTLPQIADLILASGLLKANGLLVVEHPSARKMSSSPFLKETRKYGYSSFSFFELTTT